MKKICMPAQIFKSVKSMVPLRISAPISKCIFSLLEIFFKNTAEFDNLRILYVQNTYFVRILYRIRPVYVFYMCKIRSVYVPYTYFTRILHVFYTYTERILDVYGTYFTRIKYV